MGSRYIPSTGTYITGVDPNNSGKHDNDNAIEMRSKGSLQDDEIDRALSP